MFIRRKKLWALNIIGLTCLGLQFTNPAHINPAVDQLKTLESTTTVPEEVSEIFARSCNDCHSNRTNWRWYTYVAPVSWFTVGHVIKGRSELNFSEWGNYSTRKKETRLRAICEQCEKGEMPLGSYAFVHREVKLTRDEVRSICEWTKEEGKRMSVE